MKAQVNQMWYTETAFATGMLKIAQLLSRDS